MRDKIDRLENFVNRLRDSKMATGEVTTATIVKDESTPDVQQSATGRLSSLTGNLKLSESGATRYVGPANWESIIEDVSAVTFERYQSWC